MWMEQDARSTFLHALPARPLPGTGMSQSLEIVAPETTNLVKAGEHGEPGFHTAQQLPPR